MRDVGQTREDLASYGLDSGVVSGGALTWLSSSSVRVTAGRAWVPSDAGLYRLVRWVQTDFVGIPVGGAGNHRIDQLVVRASGAIERLAGSAAGFTNLDLRGGAAALPADAIRLSDLRSHETLGIVNDTASGYRDRRLWASGMRLERINPGGVMGIGADAWANLNYPAWAVRGEVRGDRPLRVEVLNSAYVSVNSLSLQLLVEGNAVGPSATTVLSTLNIGRMWSWLVDPLPAGSHLFGLRTYWNGSGVNVQIAGGGSLRISEETPYLANGQGVV